MTANQTYWRNHMRREHSVLYPTPQQLEARRKWVALLRTDEYEQLDGALCSGDGKRRCCLGVAADKRVTGIELASTISRHFVRGRWMMTREFIYAEPGMKSGRKNEMTTLPRPIQEAMGFHTDDIDVWCDGGPEGVAGLNDGGVPFDQIADLIEADYIKPFEG